MECRECGAEGSGNYCARCGAPLGARDEERCSACGAELGPEAYFCTECGEPVRERPRKSLRDYLPWILSGLALVAFAVGITLLVQERASPRRSGAPPTGGVIESGGPGDMGDAGGVAPEGGEGRPSGGRTGTEGAAGAMPSAEELAEMSPREAADRLFNRTMRLRSAGDEAGRARFFAQMGVRAYRRMSPSAVDADVRFHVGLLQLVRNDADAAAAEADTILSERPAHLLGLLLAARAAEARGDEGTARRWRDSLRAAARRTSLDARPEYRAHASLLEQVVQSEPGGSDAVGGGGG